MSGGLMAHTVPPHFALHWSPPRRWLRCTAAPLTDRDRAFIYAPCSPRYGYDVSDIT